MWRESAAIAGLKNMARLCGKKTENELNGYRVELSDSADKFASRSAKKSLQWVLAIQCQRARKTGQ